MDNAPETRRSLALPAAPERVKRYAIPFLNGFVRRFVCVLRCWSKDCLPAGSFNGELPLISLCRDKLKAKSSAEFNGDSALLDLSRGWNISGLTIWKPICTGFPLVAAVWPWRGKSLNPDKTAGLSLAHTRSILVGNFLLSWCFTSQKPYGLLGTGRWKLEVSQR